MKTLARLTLAGAFVFALGSAGFAQMTTTPPAAPAAPAAPAVPKAPKVPAMPKVPKAEDMATKALSKECSAKADAQGLHGKARKDFREKCKRGKE